MTEPKTFSPDMNRQKGDLNRGVLSKYEIKQKKPGPTAYPVSFKQEEKTLSTVVKDPSYKIHYNKESKLGPDLQRFIDIHKRRKQWVPPVTRYNYTADQLRKYVS